MIFKLSKNTVIIKQIYQNGFTVNVEIFLNTYAKDEGILDVHLKIYRE